MGKPYLTCQLRDLLGLKSTLSITNCANSNAKEDMPFHATGSGKAKKGKTVVVYAEDVLLDGETEVPWQMRVGGKCFDYVVTTLGRYEGVGNLATGKCLDTLGQVCIGRSYVLVSHLVKMAVDKILEEPVGSDGTKLTIDHIEGRETDFPNQPSNLRWATQKDQNENRVSRAVGE